MDQEYASMDDSKKLRLKVRFDYKGVAKQRKSLFGKPNTTQMAEKTREQKAALLRSVPVQGITIEDIDMSADVYLVYDDFGGEVAYAPVIVTFVADSLEDAVHFIMKEEFRKIEVLEPESVSLSRIDMERLLFRVNEELKMYKAYLEKKLEYWK